jgi:PAS domain S-box-containing protein
MNEETAVECMKAGAWDYVIKEHTKRLGPAVRSVLELRDLRLQSKAADEALFRANRAFRILSRCNQALIRAEDEGSLLQEICRLIVDIGDYRLACVGYALDDEQRSVEIAAWAGEATYLQGIFISWSEDSKYGHGPSGRAIRSGAPVASHNIQDDPSFSPWRDLAMQAGFLSSVALPLRMDARTFGTLNIYSDEPNGFDQEETGLLQELANDLAYGVKTLRIQQERRQAEDALRGSEKRYKELFNSIRDAILVVDTERSIINCNNTFSEVFGYSLEDLQGQKTSFIYESTQEFEKVGEALQENIDCPNFVRVINYRTKSGQVFPGETSVFYLKDINGKLRGYIGLIRDISEKTRHEAEKRQLEAQVRQAQKMEAIGTLAGGIAHDFNNILSSIIGYADLAKNDVETGSRLHAKLEQVLQAGRRATGLVRQILDFSRQTEEEHRPLQMALILKEALKLLKTSAPSTIAFTTKIDPDLPKIIADPTQIHQVIMNLCTNAVQAMQEGGGKLAVGLQRVNLQAREAERCPSLSPGPHLQLTVSDTGEGISPAIRESIFDPYFTTKEKGEGTGLGLAVVYSIVQSLGGYISVDSEPGEGSTFTLLFPVDEAEVAAKQGLQGEESDDGSRLPTGSGHILFVDDEPPITDIGKQMLESLGYSVETRTSSVEALELFRADPYRFDAVITDMTMPHLTGDRLAREMLALRPDLPIVLCTGYSKAITSEKAHRIGIRSFVHKPLLRKDLAAVTAAALQERGS